MEHIGDSTLVKGEERNQDTVDFERSLDEFKITLKSEEEHLIELEKKRMMIQAEMEEMHREIVEEKKLYRDVIANIVSEHERLSKYQPPEESVTLEPIELSTSLFEDCKNELESTKNLDCNIELDIETIRGDLMDSYISTKESSLIAIQNYLLKKTKCESQPPEEAGASCASQKTDE